MREKLSLKVGLTPYEICFNPTRNTKYASIMCWTGKKITSSMFKIMVQEIYFITNSTHKVTIAQVLKRGDLIFELMGKRVYPFDMVDIYIRRANTKKWSYLKTMGLKDKYTNSIDGISF